MPGNLTLHKLDKEKLKNDLHNLYVVEGKLQSEIALQYNVSYQTIGQWLRKFNIPLRSPFPTPVMGTKFNELEFLGVAEELDSGKCIQWVCLCSCGTKKIIRANNVFYGRTKTCGCLSRETISKLKWQGFEGISRTMWTRIISSATKRKLEFNITKEYIWNLYLSQNKKCALTNQDIVFTKRISKEQTASLDRIHADQGYIEGNVQWTTKKINMAKQSMNNEEFIEMCRLVAENNPRETQ